MVATETIEGKIAWLVFNGLAREMDLRRLASRLQDPKDFVFVPPIPSQSDLDRWMALVVIGAAAGVNYLRPGQVIMNSSGVRWGQPSVLIGFDDGRGCRGIPPFMSHADILARGRLPVTVPEAIAYVWFYPQALVDGGMWPTGTMCRGQDLVAAVYSEDSPGGSRERVAALDVYKGHVGRLRWGVPSCEKRI